MLKNILAVISVSLMLLSCSTNNTPGYAKFYEDGKSKPVVTIAPVVDSTSSELPWSLSEEFSSLVHSNINNKKALFVAPKTEADNLLSSNDNPFASDIKWVKERFNPNEFIVFLELIKHDTSAVKDTNATNLNMSMRVRIVDIRGSEPKVILQESINESYYISKHASPTNYNNTCWGSNEYENSRMGMAHKHLAEEIVNRINDYVTLAKSR